MNYNFFLIDRKDAQDGTRIGYAYAKLHESDWISVSSDDVKDYLTVGFVKGCDYVVNDGKAYAIMKTYTDLQDKSTLFICVESIAGCDNKKVFNNLDRSSIIVRPTKNDGEDDPKKNSD